jgi:hypothetical protein
MPTRKVYHTVYDSQARVWKNILEGGSRASSTHATKIEAEARVRELAKATPLGQAKIHRRDGTFEKEWTYGADPERFPG